MICFHRWLNKYTIHWQLGTIHELWNSIIYPVLQNVISINPPSPNVIITHCVRYVTDPLPTFHSYLFYRITIVPIYAHESSKPISLTKRRIEYLTKALLAQFSKIIMFSQFLLEKSFTAIWEWFHSWNGVFLIS